MKFIKFTKKKNYICLTLPHIKYRTILLIFGCLLPGKTTAGSVFGCWASCVLAANNWTTNSRWAQLACFALHQSAMVVFTCVIMDSAKRETPAFAQRAQRVRVERNYSYWLGLLSIERHFAVALIKSAWEMREWEMGYVAVYLLQHIYSSSLSV